MSGSSYGSDAGPGYDPNSRRGGQLNPNSTLNRKPGFGKGEPGGAPADRGAAPDKTGAAKDAQRRGEHAADQRMHSGDGHTTSGLDRAMQAHADKMHPRVRRGSGKTPIQRPNVVENP